MDDQNASEFVKPSFGGYIVDGIHRLFADAYDFSQIGEAIEGSNISREDAIKALNKFGDIMCDMFFYVLASFDQIIKESQNDKSPTSF